MLFSKPSVTILVPAYNEEKNITQCLESIIAQEQKGFTLEKILVISDGSTDRTVSLVETFDHPAVTCIPWDQNKGIENVVDYAFQHVTSDFIFKLDGDLSFNNDHALEKILENQKKNSSDLIYADQNYRRPSRSLLERYIFRIHGYIYKQRLLPLLTEEKYFQSHIVGSYLIKKSLFQTLSIPTDIIPEDVYIFYAAQSQEYRATYLLEPQVFFAYPHSWNHHLNQITRWDCLLLGNHFSKEFVDQYNAPLPLAKVAPLLAREFLNHPLFVCILILSRILLIMKKPFYLNKRKKEGKVPPTS